MKNLYIIIFVIIFLTIPTYGFFWTYLNCYDCHGPGMVNKAIQEYEYHCEHNDTAVIIIGNIGTGLLEPENDIKVVDIERNEISGIWKNVSTDKEFLGDLPPGGKLKFETPCSFRAACTYRIICANRITMPMKIQC